MDEGAGEKEVGQSNQEPERAIQTGVSQDGIPERRKRQRDEGNTEKDLIDEFDREVASKRTKPGTETDLSPTPLAINEKTNASFVPENEQRVSTDSSEGLVPTEEITSSSSSAALLSPVVTRSRSSERTSTRPGSNEIPQSGRDGKTKPETIPSNTEADTDLDQSKSTGESARARCVRA